MPLTLLLAFLSLYRTTFSELWYLYKLLGTFHCEVRAQRRSNEEPCGIDKDFPRLAKHQILAFVRTE